MNEAPAEPASVDVCVCTYRRESLAATLASLASQTLPDDVTMRVIVADNDESPTAWPLVGAAPTGLTVTYLHAPARNISIARNACLQAARAPLVAFIDDDETAPPGWLAALLAGYAATGAPIVLGPVRASYDAGLPEWLEESDLHSTRPAIRRTGVIDTGYSCNVLFALEIVGSLRFDPALGRTGGEDDVFFSTLARRGHRIAFAPEAWLTEPVTPARATLGWLLRRAFRNGQTIAAIRLGAGSRRPALIASSVAKAAACGLLALGRAGSRSGWRKSLVRGALHAGAVGRALGKRELRLY